MDGRDRVATVLTLLMPVHLFIASDARFEEEMAYEVDQAVKGDHVANEVKEVRQVVSRVLGLCQVPQACHAM